MIIVAIVATALALAWLGYVSHLINDINTIYANLENVS